MPKLSWLALAAFAAACGSQAQTTSTATQPATSAATHPAVAPPATMSAADREEIEAHLQPSGPVPSERPRP